MCEDDHPETELLRIAVGCLASVRDERFNDARTLVQPLCLPHAHGAVAVALLAARHADVMTAELHRRYRVDDDADDDDLRDEVLHRLALDLAAAPQPPHPERTHPS